ncbi:hypothetical protein [Rugamonas rivuli]|uniref:Lipoprotein n=1 Tax=Rugamonas rivuli TaxID=2743358 RepID=A0A843SEV9_9BURK|nr:hypothetical protein [Rugamonas rivuli]MQA20690.1 hypothetical protein [Rugamonas rivuli]
MLQRLAIVGSLAILLSACASPPRIALTPDVRQQISDVRAQAVVWQDELIVRAEAPGVSAALGGGLLGAMIDSNIIEGRQNAVQGAIDPFYASIDDLDFRQQMWTAMDPAFQSDFGFKFSQVDKGALIRQGKELNATVEALKPNQGYLYVKTEYTLTPDYSRLNIHTWALMWKGGNTTPVYQNTLFYQSAAVGPGGVASVPVWAADHGQKYRAAVAEGIAQTVQMLKLDLAANAADKEGRSVVVKQYTGAASVDISGPLMSEQNGRVIARHANGTVYSLVN